MVIFEELRPGPGPDPNGFKLCIEYSVSEPLRCIVASTHIHIDLYCYFNASYICIASACVFSLSAFKVSKFCQTTVQTVEQELL